MWTATGSGENWRCWRAYANKRSRNWPVRVDTIRSALDGEAICMSLIDKIRAVVGIRAKASELISVVLNFRQPTSLTDERIHTAIARAWGRDVREDLNEHVVNRPPICFVKFDGVVLLLTNGAKPYCPPEFLSQTLAQFPEERQKKVAREHQPFLTLDLLSPKNPVRQRNVSATAEWHAWPRSSWMRTASAFTFLKPATCAPTTKTSSKHFGATGHCGK